MNVNEYIQSVDDPWDLKKIGKDPKLVNLLQREIGKAGRVLDVGGGYGFYADSLREIGNSVVVLDSSEKMISYGEKMFPGIDFVKSDALDMPFSSQSFDAVVCMGTLMYIEDKDKFFKEVHRVLKKNGVVLLYERNRHAFVNRIVSIFKNTEQASDKRSMFLSKRQVKTLAKANGFMIKKINGTCKNFLVAILIRNN